MTLKEMTRVCAFTMAEILLSLTIIGVVAAITLPSLTGNINERTWNTQRKALYARFSQAIALMPSLNGYGTLSEETSSGAGDAVDTAAETFITSGLSKVLKINNVCDSEHIQDCGLASKIVTLNGSQIDTPETMEELNSNMVSHSADGGYSQMNTKAAAFETANGESILTFYNPNCVSDLSEMTKNAYYQIQPKICVNFIFDLNGNKGPNTVGKDIGFMTVLYSSDASVVAPDVPVQKVSTSASFYDALKMCKEQDTNYRIPTLDELSSMFVNYKLMTGSVGSVVVDIHWSATPAQFSTDKAWVQSFAYGRRIPHLKTQTYSVRCVKR